MKLSKEAEAAILKAHDSYWSSYLKGDVPAMVALLTDDYTQVGSADDEVFNNKEKAVQFLYDTIGQVAGKLEMRNRNTTLQPQGDLVMVHERCDLFAKAETGWFFYSRFRATTLMIHQQDGWKIIHQHSSFPDTRAGEGENIAVEKMAEENQQLKEAVRRRTIELEQKTRELEIESSLERVRTVAMGMNKSDDILNICKIMFTELKLLGFGELRNALINFWDDEHNSLLDYDYSDFSGGHTVHIPYNSHPTFEKFQQRIRSSTDAFAELIVHEDELESWKERRRSSSEYEDPRLENIAALYYYFYSIGVGAVGISTFSSLTKEKLGLLRRFRNVFDLSYRRYMDIQKAEAQAREAQIEASLERVRSKAMMMQKSEDLSNAVAIVFEELDKLNLGILRCGIGIPDKNKRSANIFTTAIADNNTTVQVSGYESMDIHPLAKNAFEGWLKQEDFEYVLKGSDLNDYYKALRGVNFKLPQSQSLVSTKENICQYYFNAIFPSGGLFAFSENAFAAETKLIIKRFANVFEQTYTRFRDLQKAEAQAREAQIEAALERVRSRTLAMQKSDELAETAAVLFKQLIGLGIAPNRLYIGIINDDSGAIEFWITDEDGTRVSTMFSGDANKNASMKKMYDGWLSQKKSIVIDMQGKELADYFHYLGEELHVPFKDGLSQKRRLQYISYFSKGFIGMASPGEQPQETVELVDRFAYVFNLTFTRFNDLKIAEAHALQAEQDLIEIKTARKKAEDTLSELQATQRQLIQSEKMASLGELTAGIAHEIQNPLNFVNNFSEVNKELIEELKEERHKVEVERNTAIEEEILNDIDQNLDKIAFHGKRADAIVKGMLQHSRTSTGQKEPTDINALCDEYLRLSYHGLRAKDKSFNADFKTDFDNTIGKINIVPQDIGRVVLNLFNNAFYAVKPRNPPGAEEHYQPLVMVSTRKITPLQGTGAQVEIIVKDNGNGIPQNIIDKIFQPFFTTKPTGQGTGLGLSLAYDIITKEHNGTIKVESKEGEGSEFIILLPV